MRFSKTNTPPKGGWVIGSLLSDEPWCRSATQTLGLIVVDVDYRLAPEHPHPAQVWDSWAALKWVFASASSLNIDPSRVSIGGLSAGGHIAAVLALLARDEPGMPALRLQLLIVPAVDARSIPLEGPVADGVEYGSMRSCEFAPCLPLNRMRWFSRHWLGTDVGKSASPPCPWRGRRMTDSSCKCRGAKEEARRVDLLAHPGILSRRACTSIDQMRGV